VINSPTSGTIAQNMAGDDRRFSYASQTHFTPATLAFTDAPPIPACLSPVGGTRNCTLTCPSGYCSIRIRYKF
jgi:hypothetical protein